MNSKVILKVNKKYSTTDCIFYTNLMRQKADFFVPGFAFVNIKILKNTTNLFIEDLKTRLQLVPCLKQYADLEVTVDLKDITVFESDHIAQCMPGLQIWSSNTPFSIAFSATIKKGYKVEHAKFTVVNSISYSDTKKTIEIIKLDTVSTEEILEYIK